MSDKSSAGAAAQSSPESLPWCQLCGKPVESLTVTPDPNHAGMVVVEYHCHDESARQTMPSAALHAGRGLAGYTAFNDYTSGLLPRK